MKTQTLSFGCLRLGPLSASSPQFCSGSFPPTVTVAQRSGAGTSKHTGYITNASRSAAWRTLAISRPLAAGRLAPVAGWRDIYTSRPATRTLAVHFPSQTTSLTCEWCCVSNFPVLQARINSCAVPKQNPNPSRSIGRPPSARPRENKCEWDAQKNYISTGFIFPLFFSVLRCTPRAFNPLLRKWGFS